MLPKILGGTVLSYTCDINKIKYLEEKQLAVSVRDNLAQLNGGNATGDNFQLVLTIIGHTPEEVMSNKGLRCLFGIFVFCVPLKTEAPR